MNQNTKDTLDKHRKSIMRHIDTVRQNCEKLGEVLIDNGEIELGHRLIANGYCHDNSKFLGAEWLYLNDDTRDSSPLQFQAALIQHIQTNKHHPEAWEGGVHDMDRLHRAEMVCDLAARSSEFGTDVRDFLKEKAVKKYDMHFQSKAYKEIKELMSLLLDPPFS